MEQQERLPSVLRAWRAPHSDTTGTRPTRMRIRKRWTGALGQRILNSARVETGIQTRRIEKSRVASPERRSDRIPLGSLAIHQRNRPSTRRGATRGRSSATDRARLEANQATWTQSCWRTRALTRAGCRSALRGLATNAVRLPHACSHLPAARKDTSHSSRGGRNRVLLCALVAERRALHTSGDWRLPSVEKGARSRQRPRGDPVLDIARGCSLSAVDRDGRDTRGWRGTESRQDGRALLS